ncbi:MAG: arylsulfatase A-like enzyme [Bacteroidia bacterium]|jgi:arylsulfatase A-like enzyme
MSPTRPSFSFDRSLTGWALGRLLLMLGMVVTSACTGGQPGSEQAGRGVLVIAIDALRADHLSSYGYDRHTTPFMDAFGREAVIFDRTWSASPRLLPAHCAMLMGSDADLSRRLYIMESPIADELRFQITDKMPHAAVSFIGAGYRTAAFVDHEQLNPVNGLGAGFQEFSPMGKLRPGNGPAGDDVGIAGTSRRFLDWARGLDNDEDWFSYIQVSDLERVWNHNDPGADGYFEPRPELKAVPPISNSAEAFFAQPRSRWMGGAVSMGQYEARYDGRLRSLDKKLGSLFAELKRAGLWETTTICIVGSFGVQFGEAGLILDHGLYSSADLQVPWLIRPADGDRFEPGHRSKNLASTTDLIPTLLELEGIDKPGGMLGLSQVPALRPGSEPVREFAYATCGYQEGGAVIGQRYILEHVFPGVALGGHGTGLRRGWFGDEEMHEGHSRMRFYDSKMFPLPDFRLADETLANGVPPLEQARLAAAAITRFANTSKARQALHGSSWRKEKLSVEEVDKLIELGFLGSRP